MKTSQFEQLLSDTMEDDVLTTHQVAKILKVSPNTVINWIKRKKLASFATPGGHRRIKVSDLRRFLGSNPKFSPYAITRAGGKKRILVVDDDPKVASTLKRDFEGHLDAYEIEGCTDGIEAVYQIGSWRPDMVLLDIYMEGISSFDVCRRLRRIRELEDMLLVATSAAPSEQDRARILDHGAVEYLQKPLDPTVLMKLLEEAQKPEDGDNA
jgi:excisionase family DNA binding protein